MRIYVAAKYETKDEVEKVYAVLRKHGHMITYPWAELVEVPGQETTVALKEVGGVEACGAFLLYPHEKGCGQYVELGVAVASHKPIVAVVEPGSEDFWKRKNIFFHLPLVVFCHSTGEAIEYLNRWARVA